MSDTPLDPVGELAEVIFMAGFNQPIGKDAALSPNDIFGKPSREQIDALREFCLPSCRATAWAALRRLRELGHLSDEAWEATKATSLTPPS